MSSALFLTLVSFLLAATPRPLGAQVISSEEPGAETEAQSESVPLDIFAPSGLPGRQVFGQEAASRIITAIAANFWLDGAARLSPSTSEFFTHQTDPWRAEAEDDFSALADAVRGRPLLVPVHIRLIPSSDTGFAVGFEWLDSGIPAPPTISVQTVVDRQCFRLVVPMDWSTIEETEVDLDEPADLNQRNEARLQLLVRPLESYPAAKTGEETQRFGRPCDGITMIRALPVSAWITNTDGTYLSAIKKPDQ